MKCPSRRSGLIASSRVKYLLLGVVAPAHVGEEVEHGVGQITAVHVIVDKGRELPPSTTVLRLLILPLPLGSRITGR